MNLFNNREDDKISPPVSNKLTKFDESETIKVPYQNLDIEEPYAVSAKSLSKDLFTESSINCAYEIVERKKVTQAMSTLAHIHMQMYVCVVTLSACIYMYVYVHT